MQTEIFAIQRGVARGGVLGEREAQAEGGRVNPVRGSFEFEEHADGGLVNGDDSGRRGEFRPVLFVAEARRVAETIEDQLKGGRVGDIELDLLAALIALPGGRTFICDGGPGPGSPETQKLIGILKRRGTLVEELIAFEGPRLADGVSGALDQVAGLLGTGLKGDFDLGFDQERFVQDVLLFNDTMSKGARSSAG